MFANPAAAGMVGDVKLCWLPGFQHAATDVVLHLSIDTGPVERLVAPKRMPQLPPLNELDNVKFEDWAQLTWAKDFGGAYKLALAQGNTKEAWQACEDFDAECLQMRLELSGVEDPKAARGRGGVPRKVRDPFLRRSAPGNDLSWSTFVAWLSCLFSLYDKGTVTAHIQLETWWRIGCPKFLGFLRVLLRADCVLPGGTDWWHELRLRLHHVIGAKQAEAARRQADAKAAWAKKMRSIVQACKQLKEANDKQTTHLVDRATGEIVVAVSRMHDMLLIKLGNLSFPCMLIPPSLLGTTSRRNTVENFKIGMLLVLMLSLTMALNTPYVVGGLPKLEEQMDGPLLRDVILFLGTAKMP